MFPHRAQITNGNMLYSTVHYEVKKKILTTRIQKTWRHGKLLHSTCLRKSYRGVHERYENRDPPAPLFLLLMGLSHFFAVGLVFFQKVFPWRGSD